MLEQLIINKKPDQEKRCKVGIGSDRVRTDSIKCLVDDPDKDVFDDNQYKMSVLPDEVNYKIQTNSSYSFSPSKMIENNNIIHMNKTKTKFDIFLGNILSNFHHNCQQLSEEDLSNKNLLDHIEEIVINLVKTNSIEKIHRLIHEYDKILFKTNASPRTLIQKSDLLRLVYYMNPNKYPRNLEHAIKSLSDVLSLQYVSDCHFILAANNLVSIYVDAGSYTSAIDVQKKLCFRFPNDASILNTLGSLYFKADQQILAKAVFQKVLLK